MSRHLEPENRDLLLVELKQNANKPNIIADFLTENL